MIDIKIRKLTAEAQIPCRMTKHAAGYDLYSANIQDIIIKSGKVGLIPAGISISLPAGYEAQIRPRSGLAIKNQIGILNSPGTIDADYRGEIKVVLFNFSEKDFIVKPQMRIAQMIITKHEEANFILTEKLGNTKRGNGGFGHTSY